MSAENAVTLKLIDKIRETPVSIKVGALAGTLAVVSALAITQSQNKTIAGDSFEAVARTLVRNMHDRGLTHIEGLPVSLKNVPYKATFPVLKKDEKCPVVVFVPAKPIPREPSTGVVKIPVCE